MWNIYSIFKRLKYLWCEPETKKPKTLVWSMTADVALEFYEQCMKRGANTIQERNRILLELAQEGKITSVVETGRTPDEITNDLARNYGSVFRIKAREKQNESETEQK